MARKRKTSRTQTGKQRSLLRVILSGVGRLLLWLVAFTYYHARKNPLMAIGFFLFIVGFGFVTFNALFYQTASHHNVFIQTRPLQSLQQNNDNGANAINSTGNAQPSAPATVEENSVATVIENNTTATVEPAKLDNTGFSELADNLLDAQKKLTALGLYDGPLDGLDGPKTRNAIAAWKQSGKKIPSDKRASITNGAHETHDDIASLIASQSPTTSAESKAALDHTKVDSVTTQSLSTEKVNNAPETIAPAAPAAKEPNSVDDQNYKPATAEIMRVQAGLRAFGNDHVNVTGTEDDNTAEALRQFQKMFSLSVTGKINREVIDKMKEIGLFG